MNNATVSATEGSFAASLYEACRWQKLRCSGAAMAELSDDEVRDPARAAQSRCAASQSFAAFTNSSKAAPLSSSARLSAGSSGCSAPVSSSGILSSRTAFINRARSEEHTSELQSPDH